MERRILLPDGRPAADAGASIDIDCRAMPVAAERWREVPIRIRVSLEGFEDFEGTIDDLPAVLRPAAPRDRPADCVR